MLKPKRRYSEDDKATTLAVLQSCNGNVTRTARETGIPAATISKWRDGKHINESVTEMCDIKKEELSDVFEHVARLYINRALSDEVIGETKGKDAIIGAATAVDKMLLLRGAPTAINQTTQMTDEERAARVREIVGAGEARLKAAGGTLNIKPQVLDGSCATSSNSSC